MTSRRSFVKSAALLSAGALFSPNLLAAPKSYIGLQLYTVREAMQQDPAGTLARIAKLGYTSVEGATYTGSQKFYGMDPTSFTKLLKQHGLIMPSSHYRLGEEQDKGQPVLGTMLHGWDKAVDDAAQAGVKYMVCAYLSEAERGNLDHYKYVADQLNKAGERSKKAGIQLCYHNHDFEFMAQNGQMPFDLLLNNTSKDLVKMELDLYWATKAGQDPVALFKKHPGRFPLWHVKDMDNTAKKNFTEVGNGVIDFKRIFAQANTAGMKYFFVEQDQTPGSPFDSIQKSIAHIKRTLV
ncbi:sugar phosphate isomerase/epimerase [Hymenobacter taeanensis]|uniref:Sugar phosphate isomerase/epimerase n=1 Tax=Hymenobacter taeanensis TaxID=2735321 RepID=A0A6M6BLW3_9BACT|nr:MULTISPECIES: sugar phosphate isomerase/epimerase [Hymenobacter]QJX48095.1 sugar phosphate isomerase/epimerase [Hymenobacter taeanensis]UOQ82439.1 sugar phosphate isomerase/epimerase [Hymenobacter sp. 5414T-23]